MAVVNTIPLSIHRPPAARRSISCRVRCSTKAVTIAAGKGRVRREAGVFGRTHLSRPSTRSIAPDSLTREPVAPWNPVRPRSATASKASDGSRITAGQPLRRAAEDWTRPSRSSRAKTSWTLLGGFDRESAIRVTAA